MRTRRRWRRDARREAHVWTTCRARDVARFDLRRCAVGYRSGDHTINCNLYDRSLAVRVDGPAGDRDLRTSGHSRTVRRHQQRAGWRRYIAARNGRRLIRAVSQVGPVPCTSVVAQTEALAGSAAEEFIVAIDVPERRA